MKWFALSILAAVLALFLIAISPVNAGLLDAMRSVSGQTVRSLFFKITARGWDLKAYKFKVPGEDKTCVFVAGTQKGGLACW